MHLWPRKQTRPVGLLPHKHCGHLGSSSELHASPTAPPSGHVRRQGQGIQARDAQGPVEPGAGRPRLRPCSGTRIRLAPGTWPMSRRTLALCPHPVLPPPSLGACRHFCIPHRPRKVPGKLPRSGVHGRYWGPRHGAALAPGSCGVALAQLVRVGTTHLPQEQAAHFPCSEQPAVLPAPSRHPRTGSATTPVSTAHAAAP